MNDLFRIPGPWRGTLAVVLRPRGGDWLEDDARAWRSASLDVVVSLLEKEEATQLELSQEGDAVESNNIRFISFPIPDRSVPASTSDALSLLRALGDALDEGKNVGVHCRQSVGRAGMVAAGLLVTSGMSADAAIDVVSAARGQAIPETPEQFHWIRRLPSPRLALSSR